MLSLRVVIAGNDGPPLIISLQPTASIQLLTDAIFDDPSTQLSKRLHRLRFIFAGKNLSPSTLTLDDTGLTDGAFVHCVVADATLHDETVLIASEQDALIPCEHDNGLVTIDLGPTESDDGDGSDDGTFDDWCWGFVLGALLGLIMMILAMDKSIALSAKWKRGIGYGTGVNVLFGVFLLATGRLR